MRHKIRVFIISELAMVRAALRTVIEARSGMVVAGEAENCLQTLEAVSPRAADVFILDPGGDAESRLDLLPELISSYPEARVIVFASANQTSLHRQAINSGAAGIVLKEQGPDSLIHVIEQPGSESASPRSSRRTSALENRDHDPPDTREQIQSLTLREKELIQLFAQGLDRNAIAEKLGISENTVRNHLTSILSKLDLRNRFDLIFYAHKHGLADQTPGPSALDDPIRKRGKSASG